MTDLIVYIVLLLPLAWSAAVAGLRRLVPGSRMPDDVSEKYQLLIMVTPILIGALWLVLPRFVSIPLPLPPLSEDGPAGVAAQIAVVTPAKAAIDLKPWLMMAALMAWAVGALIRTAPLISALSRLSRTVARAGQGEIEGVAVRLTLAPVPPLAWGSSTILLPVSLAARMAPEELAFIVRHEQAHLGRRDPLYFAALGVLDAVLWFNPFVRAQTKRCRLAAELACDALAAGKNSIERESYARVLIRTLKYTAEDVQPYAPAVMSNVKSGDYRMRLQEIMQADPAARKPKRRWLYAALATALVLVAAFQFAWAQGTSAPIPLPIHMSTPVAGRPTTAAVMQMPMAGTISSTYGWRKDPETGAKAFHRGIDIAAPVGTTVVAPADGKVDAVYSNAFEGKVVDIDHGAGLHSHLTHLDAVKVRWSDQVRAGQAIAVSGNTGRSTGPHLHFEVRRYGKTIDPASFLPVKAS